MVEKEHEPRSVFESDQRMAAMDVSDSHVYLAFSALGSFHASCYDIEKEQQSVGFKAKDLGMCTSVKAVRDMNVSLRFVLFDLIYFFQMLITGHVDKNIGVWDVRSGESIASFVAHTAPVTCIDTGIPSLSCLLSCVLHVCLRQILRVSTSYLGRVTLQ